MTNTGRAHKGYSQFTLSLSPTNAGTILRRQFDQGIFNQQANVYVGGALVGPWYRAGGNNAHRWRDDDFMIPASSTSGRSAITIKIESTSPAVDWNEFTYSLYTLKPPVVFRHRVQTSGFRVDNSSSSSSSIPATPEPK